MAVYRQVQINYWHDSFVMELTPEERYFYLYLLTNSETTQSGIFEIHKRMMEMDLGYSRETVDKLIKRFQEYGKIIYCEETREMMIINWMKYNFINSRNTILCINKELKEVKNVDFLNNLYKICLSKGYDVETIFEGVVLNRQEKTKEETGVSEATVKENQGNKIDDDAFAEQYSYIHNADEDMKSCSNYDYRENQDLYRGFDGAYKDLGEEEPKEKTEKESYSKQKVIDNNKKNKANHKSEQDNTNKILLEFNKNIRQATIRDIEKIMFWRKEFEEDVIIQAILQAVKYNAAHTGYVESVIKNWKTLGLFTMEKLKAYNSKGNREKQVNRCNADAYKYKD